jgi:DNA-binding MarR family transcriptional regulator
MFDIRNDCVKPKPTASATRAASRAALVDALLFTSRAMVALAARSLAGLDAEVTLPQYRALVVLASRGPQRVVDIAAELGVNPSTGTRMCDRLVAKKLIRRQRSSADRREVRVTLTAPGRQLVDEVTRRRRAELERIVDALPAASHGAVAEALRSLASTTGEIADEDWWMGWANDRPEDT